MTFLKDAPAEFATRKELTTGELLAQKNQTDLLDLLARLLRAKRRIALAAFACGLTGFGLAHLISPSYTASTQMLPPQRAASATSMLSQMSLAGSDAGGLASLGSAIQAKSAADTYAIMLAARPIADALVLRFELQSVYGAHTLTQARHALAGHTAIVAAKEGILTISVADRDPSRAAALANGYVEQLRVLMHGLALSEATQRRTFYEGQLAKAHDELAQSELAFKSMQQTSGMISLDAQSRAMLVESAELRAQLTTREIELERLRAYSTDVNPQVQIAERELTALRSEIARAESGGERSFSATSLDKVPAAGLEYLRASRDLKYRESLYDLLARQYEGSRLDEAKDAPVVQVIEPAVAPELPTGPRHTLFLFGGLALGALTMIVRVLVTSWHASLTLEESTRLSELRKALLHW